MQGWIWAVRASLLVLVFAAPLALGAPPEIVRHSPGALTTLVHPDDVVAPKREETALKALRWLAAHQCRDGGWNFDHGRDNGHVGPVRNAGRNKSRTLATAVCLTGFLSSGQTHKEGKFREVVGQGLKFLQAQRAKWEGVGADLRGEEGDVGCQAWATLALCEAYAMTMDKGLERPAQEAVQVLELMRDPHGGGWGKEPRKPGDMLTTARAIQALKSAHLTYLTISPPAPAGGVRFLDSVQTDDGTHYGLTKQGDGRAATHAAGIVCRAHLGWWRDRTATVDRCLEELCQRGPQPDLDFNDYASCALLMRGKKSGLEFQQMLRECLIDSQVSTGEAAGELGSWATPGHAYSESGGRLYETATNLSLMVRRYRLPLFQPGNEDDDF
jgi:hypothetical protein